MTIRNVIPTISGMKNDENLVHDFRMISSKYVCTG